MCDWHTNERDNDIAYESGVNADERSKSQTMRHDVHPLHQHYTKPNTCTQCSKFMDTSCTPFYSTSPFLASDIYTAHVALRTRLDSESNTTQHVCYKSNYSFPPLNLGVDPQSPQAIMKPGEGRRESHTKKEQEKKEFVCSGNCVVVH